MPIARETVEEFVRKLNAQRRPEHAIALESYQAPGAFALSFPNRAMPEGQCIDSDFTDIQFALHEERKIDTQIVAGKLDEDRDRYVMQYEVVEWE